MKNATEIEPGLHVQVVLAMDIQKEASDVRGALVYDINGADVILSQTNPPFMEGRHIGKDVSVTHLIKEKNGVARYGFDGKVVEVIKAYNLTSSNVVPAIRVKRQTGFRQYDLRMHYRLKPKLNDDSLALYLENEKVNLLDISIGGARFCCKGNCPIEPQETGKMILSIDERRFRIDVRNCAFYTPAAAGRLLELHFREVQFLNMDKTCNRLLNAKILAVQREMLSKG